MHQQLQTTGGTTHAELDAWVKEVAAHTQPDDVVWVDGSDEQIAQINALLVEAGTFTPLADDKKPGSFHALSDPQDVARVEDRTYICSAQEKDAGPTNNWMDPQEMKDLLRPLFEGSMRGRTMYVIPFVMGHLEADAPKYGVELTDSAYVVASMRIMARIGSDILAKMEDTQAPFVKGLHSVGAPLEPGQEDVAWPCNETKYIVHFPEELAIWSYGSGYGGNALLGKKCYALRIASVMARDEGWLAEHMLILKLTNPEGEVHYVAGAFPSACGKTNLAMIQPTMPGWKAELVGDDISWMRFGEDGRLYAVNPEFGLFGVAPGTSRSTNPVAMETVERGNSIFTNVARTPDGDIWWEGMTEEKPAELIDWHGNPWTPDSEELAAHPNSRFCTPIRQVPNIAPEYDDPRGVPISAIMFGGRRKTTVPLVTESRDWQHGTFIASTLSSETTAAATGAVGVVRRDPMAMLPFMGYNASHYFDHWLEIGKQADADKLPKVFLVNWFRKGDGGEGGFLWPGFGENARVLKWMVDRIEGRVDAQDSPIGYLPRPEDLDVDGLDLSTEEVAAALAFDRAEWEAEIPLIKEWFDTFGEELPAALQDELATLEQRLAGQEV
ncbi:phosphoenolpyruvate carboxykinase (GTP) [Ornithinimicrobium pekingense]|uniref:Phosphoenolpyruvate carboxykinase [GTP] n=1 Tax=Ornithinimicrobium pekingense TaxID=384677 RepID=A0ABQ2FE10_9MICO|nr:phosphoenolpyruvate carboxykinase (GTP) [Ornithinimicrobium pekingense]GGK78447.1 phosphoenolpyruvate carboxykinase [GTP] [Ornithinimicrobium pekingense]